MRTIVPSAVDAVDPDDLLERIDVNKLMDRMDVNQLWTGWMSTARGPRRPRPDAAPGRPRRAARPGRREPAARPGRRGPAARPGRHRAAARPGRHRGSGEAGRRGGDRGPGEGRKPRRQECRGDGLLDPGLVPAPGRGHRRGDAADGRQDDAPGRADGGGRGGRLGDRPVRRPAEPAARVRRRRGAPQRAVHLRPVCGYLPVQPVHREQCEHRADVWRTSLAGDLHPLGVPVHLGHHRDRWSDARQGARRAARPFGQP